MLEPSHNAWPTHCCTPLAAVHTASEKCAGWHSALQRTAVHPYTPEAAAHLPAQSQVPEIMRVPLEELVLQVHHLRLGTAAAFLDETLQPPPAKAAAAAVAGLRALGALAPEADREALTPLGRHLAQLPLEPRLGKLLVYAAFMGCLGGALTVAACLSYKPPFLASFQVCACLRLRHIEHLVDAAPGVTTHVMVALPGTLMVAQLC